MALKSFAKKSIKLNNSGKAAGTVSLPLSQNVRVRCIGKGKRQSNETYKKNKTLIQNPLIFPTRGKWHRV